MQKLHKEIDIKAPVGKVFSYVENPRNAPEWLHSMVDVWNVEGTGSGTHYNWTWKMAGIRFNGETDLVEDLPNQKIVFKTRGGIDSTWTYRFEPHGERTHLDLDVVYTIPLPVVGKVAEKLVMKMNDHEADTDMQNIKDKMEM